MTKKIQLNSIENVKKFVNLVNTYPCDIDLVAGRYTIDAKSIMGIFSLDLSKPIDVAIDDSQYSEKFFKEIEDFIIQ
ncbi:MAG: sugar transporter [Clostridia bacterium]|jgi:phosphotransferase system HPr-like phosphotransfer protein|nr:sugar transporter [Clostridia bacterium]